jgi:hypothetical protein
MPSPFRDDIMGHDSSGLVHRKLAALGSALKRWILGKSAHAYMKQFTGNDWQSVINAQRACQQAPICPDNSRVPTNVVLPPLGGSARSGSRAARAQS